MTRPQIKKRRNYFINKQVQGIYALFIIMSVAIISLLVSMEIMRSFYHSFGQMGKESFLANVDMLFIIKVFALLVLGSLLIGGLSLFASHRIAGPIFRLNTSLKKMAKGNFGERLSFRKHDYFQEVASNFNSMAQSLEERAQSEGKVISEMSNKVDEIVEQMALSEFDRNGAIIALQELKTIIDKCQKMLMEDRGY